MSEISRSFARNPDLLLKSPYLFFSKFDKLIEYELHPRDIIRDPAIFHVSEFKLEERMEMIKMHNICIRKPWMFKCENKKFER